MFDVNECRMINVFAPGKKCANAAKHKQRQTNNEKMLAKAYIDIDIMVTHNRKSIINAKIRISSVSGSQTPK